MLSVFFITYKMRSLSLWHAALVVPLTGSLGLYGKARAIALSLWAKKAASLPESWKEVELDVQDTGNYLQDLL
jgi:hypothetical protein